MVEKMIRGLPEAQQGGTEGTGTHARPRRTVTAARAVVAKQSLRIILGRAALRAARLLPPAAHERRFAFQDPTIEWSLIAHAIGHWAERVPYGYVIMRASAMPPGRGRARRSQP